MAEQPVFHLADLAAASTRELIAEYQQQVQELAEALADQSTARRLTAQAERDHDEYVAAISLGLVEVRDPDGVLTVEGRNETERKHRQTIALATAERFTDENPDFSAAIAALRSARLYEDDTNRRVAVLREACRLLSGVLGVAARLDPEL